MESRQVFLFAFDPEYSEEEMARMDAHRCIEEADLCDFNNALIRGFGMLFQGSKFVVAIVANATMFSHLLPGCSGNGFTLLEMYFCLGVNKVLVLVLVLVHVVANICYCHNFLVLLVHAFLCNVCNEISYAT